MRRWLVVVVVVVVLVLVLDGCGDDDGGDVGGEGADVSSPVVSQYLDDLAIHGYADHFVNDGAAVIYLQKFCPIYNEVGDEVILDELDAVATTWCDNAELLAVDAALLPRVMDSPAG